MKRYFVSRGNINMNIFDDRYSFPNKKAILKLYDTDRDKFEVEIEKIKYEIKINN